MSSWLVGFLLGSLCGVAGLRGFIAALILMLVATLSAWALRKKFLEWLLLLAGIASGNYNHAPSPPDLWPLKVLKSTPSAVHQANLLATDPSGRTFLLKGNAREGMEGLSSCSPSSSPLSSRACKLKPKEVLPYVLDPWTDQAQKILEPIKSRWHRGFLSGLLLGDSRSIPFQVKRSFQNSGLYHLLVVSGLHLNLFGVIANIALRIPFKLLYALRLISPQIWLIVLRALPFFSLSLCYYYLIISGQGAPAQRAMMTQVVWQLGPIILGKLPLLARLRLVAFLQTLSFPLGFLSLGTILSWAAYMLVLSPRPPKALRYPALLLVWEPLKLQALLCLLTWGLIGKLSLLGIIMNLWIVPFFPLFFASALLAIAALWFYPPLGYLLLQFQAQCLNLIQWCSAFGAQYIGPYTDIIETKGAIFRFCALCGVCFIILSRMRHWEDLRDDRTLEIEEHPHSRRRTAGA